MHGGARLLIGFLPSPRWWRERAPLLCKALGASFLLHSRRALNEENHHRVAKADAYLVQALRGLVSCLR